jgi:hypothetical protein
MVEGRGGGGVRDREGLGERERDGGRGRRGGMGGGKLLVSSCPTSAQLMHWVLFFPSLSLSLSLPGSRAGVKARCAVAPLKGRPSMISACSFSLHH